MGWVSPTSHSDFLGGWTNETNAYDGNLGTYARGDANKSLSLGGVGTISCYKIRIYCSESPISDDVTNVEIYKGTWIIWSGTVPSLTWFEIEFNSLITLSSINVRRTSSWRIYEFEFWDGADGYLAPVPEDYIVENENVITDALQRPQQRKIVIGPDGRIHCVFRKCLFGGYKWLVYYAYSDDYGKTWTVEDPTPGLTTYTQDHPSIAVDSSGNPHIIFHDKPSYVYGGLIGTGRYVRRSANGTWTLSSFFVGCLITRRSGPTPPPFGSWEIGDEVKGKTSEVTKIITFVFGGGDSRTLCLLGGGTGWINDEWVYNMTRSGNAKYLYEVGPEDSTAVVIDSNNRLRIVAEKSIYLWYWLQSSPNAEIGHSQGTMGPGQNITIDIDPSNLVKTVYIDGLSYYDGADDTLICTGTYPSAYLYACFSIASNVNGDVHFVLAQTGLGGDFPGVLNIKYYKRISGVWSGPTHITDVDYEQRCPSISIDTQGRIHVMWQGTGWGTYIYKYSVLMKTYENGAWGATQVILNEDKDQGAFGASLLHAWHPNSNRLQEPVYIFARQGSWKIQFVGNFYGIGGPDNLLCEQTKNPTNVGDPKPEFSAIHRTKLA